jgi:hypothetical protein
MGLLACGIILIRGLVHGAGAEATILAASGGLFLFALVGYVAGQLADMLVRESVTSQFQTAMAAWEEQQQLVANTN